ncbi:MAG TPA: ABC transporter ATP-binding protein [Kiritimatiellia bacterium]|nr:ABC transporter ATP-binding protein [Kiritimatiellia bacterium]HMP33298.1 ABC transporter ATP-binding protein [Kiritimatiellia bacterium]
MNEPTTPLYRYVLRYSRSAVAGFFSVIAAIAATMYAPQVLGDIVDAMEQGTLDRSGLLRMTGLLLGVSLLASLFSIFMRRILLGLAQRVEHDLRRDVFAHLTRMDHGFYQRERTGDIMTKMSSDLFSVKDMIGQGLLQGSRIVIGFPVAFGIMFSLDAGLALVVMAIIPVISIVFFILIRMIRSRYDEVQEQFSTISNFCQENFGGFRTVKGFGIEERMKDRFRALNETFIRLNMRLTRVEEPVWPFMVFMFSMGTLLLLLAGGRRVVEGSLSLGDFVKFNQYLVILHWPMLALGWTSNLFQRGIASWRRVRTIFDARPDIRDGVLTDPRLHLVPGEIRMAGVRYAAGGRDLLRDIDLAVPAGQVLGITGPTGSGKTLLISLLCRLIDPAEGRITFGGHDIKAFPLSVLRQRIGLAPQEAFLFSDTLANNIAFGLETAPDDGAREEKVLWAAGIAHLREDVERFPLKFGTMLGERGVTLSGGQRQRTAISRALALDPVVLILDDVFSAVDTQTEARILAGLLPVLRQRTAILVSHRVSTLKHCDRILVVEDGRITQDGSHAELAARPGYYREQDEMQRLEARLEGDAP